MELISPPTLSDHGLWSAAFSSGRADLLLGALDPTYEHVLIETWDGRPGWHQATVSVGPDDEARPRLVRHHRFDVLVTPAEAYEIGVHLHAQGASGGGLGCYQFRERPRDSFGLPDHPRGRADAMRGHGVDLAIDLPHDGEVVVVSSPSEDVLTAYVARLV